MMNLAAKKKKSKEPHRDQGMAGALLKSATRRQQFGNMAHGSLDTDRRPSLARIDTLESAASLAVEFADVIHSIPAVSARNILDLTPDCPSIDVEPEMPPMTTHVPQVSNGSAFQSPAKEPDPMFRLNIGGKSYRFRIEVVLTSRMPSLLSSLIKATHEQRLLVVDGYIDETGEYYMERNVRVADHIMDYFITGLLHKPNDVCVERFREELDYWKLKHDQIAPCCSLLNDFPKLKDKEEAVKEFDGVQYAELRKTLWKLMEDPSSSFFSKIFSFISIGFIFASVIGLILGSMPEFQEDSSQAQFYHMIYHRKPKTNNTNSKFDHEETNLNLADFVYKPTDNPHHYLIFLEYVCITWFTMEYFVRFCVAPRKKKFVLQTMNLIDLCTILPFYLEFVMGFFGFEDGQLQDIPGENKSTFSRRAQSWIGAMLVIRILRVLRMARVFKLARYSQGLQIFGNTLRASMTELSMLSMFLITGTIFFSTVMYFLEKDEPYTDFYSIPAACWWCITTVTTVGYGDTFPISTAGKTVATAASICGIIILAFPISMIVEKFATAQQQALVEDQLRQAQMSAVANDYLLKRFPTRRKACKDPLVASIHKNPRQSIA